MKVRCFYDTNVLLYAISADPAEAHKCEVARTLLSASDWGLSAQVLQEFFVNATRTRRDRAAALTHADGEEVVRSLMRYPVAGTDAALISAAFAVRARWQTSFWDACIIASAQRLGAEVLVSEDLSHGQVFDGLTVQNPFLLP
jgi:predicted nucleic acid-binding protein